jgi:Zn-dependent M28 family amino/carboxypeptidase
MKRSVIAAIFLAMPLALFAANELSESAKEAAAITSDGLLEHIKVLASDKFEGRAPGSKGEELTVRYLTEQFKKLGLKPGKPKGGYTQEIPLAGVTGSPSATFTIGGKNASLEYPDQFVAFTSRLIPEVEVSNSDLVFVGYGVVAPEYGWDDYKDIDLQGKTIVVLINDPAIPDPNDPAKLDDKMFKGRAMTYYGRWSYKYEMAARKGAAAAVIVHETVPAAYGWQVVRNSNTGENFVIDAANKNMDTVPIRSWITLETAKKLFADSGRNFDELKKSALEKDFRPVSLGGTADFTIKNKIRRFTSRNVVARVEGSDSKLKDEVVIYTAHWDHLGRDPELKGDQIYNGAVDNASGVAALLEIAEAYTLLPQPPLRSILFIATTGEESGLLGAKFYAEHPLFPLEKTLADINIDSMNVWGKARDIEVVSFRMSTLDDMLARAAQRQGRTAIPSSRPEKGSPYRADSFEFAKVGVPSLYIGKGEHLLSRAPDAPLRADEFDQQDYHQVGDEIDATWDLSGAAQDAQLVFEVGCQVANGEHYPTWTEGSEFKARRDEMMEKKAIGASSPR